MKKILAVIATALVVLPISPFAVAIGAALWAMWGRP